MSGRFDPCAFLSRLFLLPITSTANGPFSPLRSLLGCRRAFHTGGITMKSCSIIAVFTLSALTASATTINVGLGTASVYTVLGGTSVASTGETDIGGNVGVGPGGAVSGFPPGIVTGGGILVGSDPF